MSLSIDEVLAMSNEQLFALVLAASPLDLQALGDTQYTGVDLSMPPLFHRLFWRSFRKTFHLDPVTGVLRGWNVKVEQTGWEDPPAAKVDKSGRAQTFGHYEVRSATGIDFPKGWSGQHYLDYTVAGNKRLDFPARAGFCPLVCVNSGDMRLLLGWEVFKLGRRLVPINDFWLLKKEGPLTDVVKRPDEG
jgi:hypothetical protein